MTEIELQDKLLIGIISKKLKNGMTKNGILQLVSEVIDVIQKPKTKSHSGHGESK